MTARFPIRLAAPALTALAIILVPAHADARGRTNRTLDSVHQPVVSHSLYTFDVQAGMGGLSPAEATRLEDWYRSIGLGYGDQVAIAGDSAYVDAAARDGIADVTARHGLLIGEDSSAAAGQAPAGSVRLIVRRASASVPGCPDWSEQAETNDTLSGTSNFGCGVNSNWAAMVADPEDLVRGQGNESGLRTATSNRAISTYRDKQPTGAGDLKQLGGQ
ncbi:pilus assembly protein CpaD [Sphingobium amiense]|uniref:Pilus assembly protein CpaD n=1 Tax=Sphingobium amiense TaxID=135719 RepID=A0A494W8X4_9SPHN|nr:CpaD family pilus assembly lipoprotein [Sphingobium amiense]BBD96842.1 pilus assembly protein CpaD [Sphingobium amiense]